MSDLATQSPRGSAPSAAIRRLAAIFTAPGTDKSIDRARLVALLIILAFGALCRTSQYAARASYWHDEAYLVSNIFNKSAAELMGPLDYHQAAPPAFLLLLRGSYVAFGPSEYALRAFPLIAGLGALLLFGWIAWRILPHEQALWAAALFALSDELIFHAANAKQYSSDVLVASMLVALAVAWRRSLPTRMIALSLVASAALWVSHPTAFVFGAVSLAFLPQLWRHARHGLIVWLGGNLLVAGSFLLLYLVSIRFQHDQQLYDYWVAHGAFPDLARIWTLPLWLIERLVDVSRFPFGPLGVIVTVLATCGVIAFWQNRRFNLLAALIGPIVLLLAAATLRQYPFDGSRVILFLTPALALLAGRGIGWMLHLPPWPARTAGLVLALIIVAGSFGAATYRLFVPRIRSHIRPAVRYVQQARQPGESLHILGRVRSNDQEFFCYWQNPPPPVHTGFDPADIRPGDRFWIVAAFKPSRGLNAIAPELSAAAEIADEVDRYVGIGGAAIQFQVRSDQ